jgi:pimeloyl-ACP methyl ester carboxylesterase
MPEKELKTIETTELQIAYFEQGASEGWPVILSHGFPYDPHAFTSVAAILARAGARVITPYTRGFGPTRFLSDTVMRSGQQAARGRDILQLADALALDRPILGGFDWGGNASCVAAALWPRRFAGLVSYAGYDIIDIAAQSQPSPPSFERICWYQHLFQSERGRRCLSQNRRDMCRILWRDWSPGWEVDEETFARSAEAFENPDFVDVVIHCYRHIFGNEAGAPDLQAFEDLLAQKPVIAIPTITLDGTADPLKPGGTASHARMFTGPHEHRVVNAGHNLPQQTPGPFADAVLTVLSLSS